MDTTQLRNRDRTIEQSNFCPTYKEFLKRYPDKPIPGTPHWKSNVPYIIWINRKHREFRELKGYPPNYSSKDYLASFEEWLLNGG